MVPQRQHRRPVSGDLPATGGRTARSVPRRGPVSLLRWPGALPPRGLSGPILATCTCTCPKTTRPRSASPPPGAYSVRRPAGQWGTCEGEPARAAIWADPRGARWRAFACDAHAVPLDGASPLNNNADLHVGGVRSIVTSWHSAAERWASSTANAAAATSPSLVSPLPTASR